MRRFTRLTSALSKKVENRSYAVALRFMLYSYCRIHKTLQVSPAMAAGLTERLWDLEDIVALIDEMAPKAGLRGPYMKRKS